MSRREVSSTTCRSPARHSRTRHRPSPPRQPSSLGPGESAADPTRGHVRADGPWMWLALAGPHILRPARIGPPQVAGPFAPRHANPRARPSPSLCPPACQRAGDDAPPRHAGSGGNRAYTCACTHAQACTCAQCGHLLIGDAPRGEGTTSGSIIPYVIWCKWHPPLYVIACNAKASGTLWGRTCRRQPLQELVEGGPRRRPRAPQRGKRQAHATARRARGRPRGPCGWLLPRTCDRAAAWLGREAAAWGGEAAARGTGRRRGC